MTLIKLFIGMNLTLMLYADKKKKKLLCFINMY